MNAAALAKLDAGGSVTIGAFLASHQNTGPLVQADNAMAVFQDATADMVFQTTRSYAGNLAAPPPGLCVSSVATPNFVTGLLAINTVSPYLLPTFHDAGPSLTLVLQGAGTNPQAVISLPQQSGAGDYTTANPYCLSLGCNGPAFLTGGSWTLNAPGGADVGAFTAGFTLPTMPQWTNAESFDGQNVPRSSNLTVTWTGGDPNDMLLISGYAEVLDFANPANSTAQSFTCSVSVSVGTLTVGANMLKSLPAAPTPSATIAYGGTLSISTGATANFTAPLKAGGSLDAGAITWNWTSTRFVNWQ